MPTQYIVYPSSSGGGATTVTADQGDPNTLANAWPVKVTDGIDVVAVTDSGELNVIASQPTGSNLHVVVDSGTVTASNPSVASTGAAVPASATFIGFEDTSGDLSSVVLTASGELPVSAASLPLPSGAATAANQVTGNNSLASIDGKIVAVNTGAVVVSSSALPTGAATETTLSALNGKFSSLGQKTMANSAPVVLASDQSAIPVTFSAGAVAKVNLIRNDYSSVNVTTGAYVQLVASTAADINKLDVFDSSGQTLVVAVGAAASEVDQFYVYPGGNGYLYLNIPSGSRLSIKAVSATANVGELVINTFS